MSRALMVVDVSEYNESINIMIHGNIGVGKTVLGGQAPNGIFLASEPGVISARRSGSTSKMVRISNWDDAWAFADGLEEGKYQFDWVVVDTIDSIQTRAMRHKLKEGVATNPAKRDLFIPGQDQHQWMQNATKQLVERLVDAPVNCLFLAHSMRVEDNDGEALMIPAIDGQRDKGYGVSNYCMALMNAVGYMGIRQDDDGEEQRRILWKYTVDSNKGITYVAKDHFGTLPRVMADPTMAKIIEAINQPAAAPKTKKGKGK